MEALLHQRSVRLWVALGNVGSRTRLSRGLSGCTPSQIQRILLHAPGWESAALRMGLELDEIAWFSERPADLQ